MMWKCNNCGKAFEFGEETHSEEYMGDCYGTRSYYEHSCCPHCGSSDFDEAYECDICGEVISVDEATVTGHGVYCEKCKDKIHEKYDCNSSALYELTKDVRRVAKISTFLLRQFDVEEIERILLAELVARDQSPVYPSNEDFIEDFFEEVAEREDYGGTLEEVDFSNMTDV